MSIIVQKNEAIDEALKRLHGEAIRENIFEVMNDKRYYIKPNEKRSVGKREWKKRKKRRRQAKRRSKKS